MNITIDKTVSYEVAKVVITNVTINKAGNGLLFLIPFSWIDAQGKTLNQSMKRFSSTELIQLATGLGLDFAPFVTMLNGILSTGKVSLRLDLRDGGNIKGMVVVRSDDGKYSNIKLEGEAFTTAIAPFTQQNIVDIIQTVSVQLT